MAVAASKSLFKVSPVSSQQRGPGVASIPNSEDESRNTENTAAPHKRTGFEDGE